MAGDRNITNLHLEHKTLKYVTLFIYVIYITTNSIAFEEADLIIVDGSLHCPISGRCWQTRSVCFVVGNELTGNTNLITHYNLEHAYNKFCGKKVKEKLSNFLPELPGEKNKKHHATIHHAHPHTIRPTPLISFTTSSTIFVVVVFNLSALPFL